MFEKHRLTKISIQTGLRGNKADNDCRFQVSAHFELPMTKDVFFIQPDFKHGSGGQAWREIDKVISEALYKCLCETLYKCSETSVRKINIEGGLNGAEVDKGERAE